MMSPVTLDQLDDIIMAVAALATALGALIASLVQGAKTRADIGSLHRKVQRKMDTDHGTSLRDAVNRIEAAQTAQGRALRGMAKDVGRLADADYQLRESADRAHESLAARISRIEDTMLREDR